MNPADIVGGLLTGGIGGIVSGFLGVTSGGVLVPLLVLLLGKDQHVAQGISLFAQVTVPLTALMKVSQAMSLAVTALPVTLPAADLYVRQGAELPWITIISLIVGLWVGTGIEASFANRVSPNRLRLLLIITIATMAIFMAFKAWQAI
jgi:uncharacterized membrane protein YfcA